jgi:lipopolysaccharide export LptBFGC system permease protein LptF
MAFAKSGLLPPWAGAWLPNLAFGSIATALFLMGEEK